LQKFVADVVGDLSASYVQLEGYVSKQKVLNERKSKTEVNHKSSVTSLKPEAKYKQKNVAWVYEEDDESDSEITNHSSPFRNTKCSPKKAKQ